MVAHDPLAQLAADRAPPLRPRVVQRTQTASARLGRVVLREAERRVDAADEGSNPSLATTTGSPDAAAS